MQFSDTEFRQVIASDLWILNEIDTLPSDPPPTIIREGDRDVIVFTDTAYMPQMQDAVKLFRRKLLPLIFFVAEKVYAELFRLALSNNGPITGKETASKVETEISKLLATKMLLNPYPFADASTFMDWWAGKYGYEDLRKGRNIVAHRGSQIVGDRLVLEENGTRLVDWDEAQVLKFAVEVLRLARTV
jgi:hypothetical protein